MTNSEENLWRDPFDASLTGAVLLSDQIQFLADTIKLVDPFSPKLLRPAAYDLSVGNSYYEMDKRIDLKDHESFEIPANGLVYVRTMEKFNIPYYLVARYSLRVQQVYRGLLIDNGLHIDPGYTGHIWIPVHNVMAEPRVLAPGQPFLSVEFNRTTPLPVSVHKIKSQDDLVKIALRGQLQGTKDRPIRVFYKDLESYNKRHAEFIPPMFWNKFLGETHKSGMKNTDERLSRVQSDVVAETNTLRTEIDRRIRWLEGLSIFAGVLLLAALLAIVLPIWYGKIGGIAEAEAQHSAEIGVLRTQIQEQKTRIEELTRRSGTNTSIATPTPQQNQKE